MGQVVSFGLRMTSSKQRVVFRTSVALGIVILITFFYRNVFSETKATTVALTFLLAILGVASGWGLLEALVMSVVATLSFNFFFLPPFGTFTIEDPQNWVAFFAFLVTSLVASQLSASAKRRAVEATKRQLEMQKLYELSRALMSSPKDCTMSTHIASCVSAVLGLDGVAVFERQTDKVYRIGVIDPPISDSRLRDAAFHGNSFASPGADCYIVPLAVGSGIIGSLAVRGGPISETAVQALANLAAVVLERSRAEEAASRMEAARQNEAIMNSKRR
jgi:two-component system sensor histidine kinase KdpD